MLIFKGKPMPEESRLVKILPILLLSGTVFAQGQVCDVDLDGDIDRTDIGLIVASRNQPATSSDEPRDADGDGVITVRDARTCTLQCTLPRCAEPPATTGECAINLIYDAFTPDLTDSGAINIIDRLNLDANVPELMVALAARRFDFSIVVFPSVAAPLSFSEIGMPAYVVELTPLLPEHISAYTTIDVTVTTAATDCLTTVVLPVPAGL